MIELDPEKLIGRDLLDEFDEIIGEFLEGSNEQKKINDNFIDIIRKIRIKAKEVLI